MYNYYEEDRLNSIKSYWNINYLKDCLKYAEKDIETIQKFIKEYTKQAERILLTQSKKIIELKRRETYEKRIFYYVSIINLIYYENEQVKSIVEKCMEFKGNERLKAITYTTELVKKYNYPVVVAGKWSERIKPKNLMGGI